MREKREMKSRCIKCGRRGNKGREWLIGWRTSPTPTPQTNFNQLPVNKKARIDTVHFIIAEAGSKEDNE